MKSCQIALAFCVVMLIGSFVTDSAAAQGYGGCRGGYGGFGGGYGNSQFGFNRGYLHSNHPAPPYFALNPPVYYGSVRPRAYGWSPFPYGPSGGQFNGSSATFSASQRVVADDRWAMSRGNGERIRNPFVDGGAPASPSDVKVEEATTGIIRNPFVDLPESRIATK
jgi:hypothetical protein